MKRVLSLARRGSGNVSPNPLVGAVIVKDGEIVGEGYHHNYRGDHAELEALKAAGRSAKNAALYCNLEPCYHWGHTPPCTDAILNAGIGKVVVGMKDPNPRVNGNGIDKLRANGVGVEIGVMDEECRSMNAFYTKFIATGRPFVTVKMAQSLDGKITRNVNSRFQITSEAARRYVHRLRTRYDAVIIGKRTAQIDNPVLSPRLVSGRTPARIILDTHLECDPMLRIFHSANLGKIYIATESRDAKRHEIFKNLGVFILHVNTDDRGVLRLSDLLTELAKLRITSVLVEGGAEVFTSFIRERLADLVILLIAPYLFGTGVNVVDQYASNGRIVELKDMVGKRLGRDYMITGTPVYT